MTNNKKYAKELLAFLDAAPTPFQSTDELSKMLDKAGAVRLYEGDEWHLEKGTLYYMTKEGTQLSAFNHIVKLTVDTIGTLVEHNGEGLVTPCSYFV